MSKFTSMVMVLFPSKVLKPFAVITERWFSEAAEAVGKLPAVLKAYTRRNMGVVVVAQRIHWNATTFILTAFKCRGGPAVLLENLCHETSVGWGLQGRAVSLRTVGKIAFDFWCHLLRGTLSNGCCAAILLPLCRFSPGFGEKKSFWSENFAFLFCWCVMCTGWRGEESREEAVGRKHL